MVYGAEVVLPTDLQYGSPRVRAYQPDATEQAQKNAKTFLKNRGTPPLKYQLDINMPSDGTTHAGFTPEISR
jgi:hypothetical protein